MWLEQCLNQHTGAHSCILSLIENSRVAIRMFRRSLALAAAHGDAFRQAQILIRLAMMARYPGNHSYVLVCWNGPARLAPAPIRL